MNYTLILPNGKIMQFYIKSVAESYRNIYGGVLFTQKVLVNVSDSVMVGAYDNS